MLSQKSKHYAEVGGYFTKEAILEEDSGELIIEGYANTVTKDRAGDVIVKSAWETKNALGNYHKNPIVLAYHNHSMPIGTMIDIVVTDMGLQVKARISKAAGQIYTLIKEGVLKTFSVGFNILDADYDSKSDTYFITDVELHEVSVVSIPCNQDSTFSVAKGMEKGEFESFKKSLETTKEELPKNNTVTISGGKIKFN